MVWTIPSPSPVLRELGAARLVSTPSRRKSLSGLGSGSPFQVSPNLGSSASPVSRRALKFSLSPLRMPFRHARVAAIAYDSAASGNLHVRFQLRLCSVGSPGVSLFRFVGGLGMLIAAALLDAVVRQAWTAAGSGVGLFFW